MVKVKICGITNLDDALASIEAGCDALGFMFYKKSPRYITPEYAHMIISSLPKEIIKIGVFVNAREKTIKRISRFCNLDMLQFHGNESVGFCNKFIGYKIIKVFRIKDRIDLARIVRYKTFAYLFDTFVRSQMGGTGKKFNWKLLNHLKQIKRPIFLSGGLNGKNVGNAIRSAHPDWLDVSSSIEIRPGRKDHRKVKGFIRTCKKYAGK